MANAEPSAMILLWQHPALEQAGVAAISKQTTNLYKQIIGKDHNPEQKVSATKPLINVYGQLLEA
jgi:hypothetical protein